MEDIFNYLPFNSYEDLFSATKSGKATIKMTLSACSNIASIKHPNFSTLGLFIGFLVASFLLIGYCIVINNYWFLFILPLDFMINLFIHYTPKLNHIAWILTFIDLFIFKLPTIIFIICLSIIVINFFYKIWWNKIYKIAFTELEYNKDIFLIAWNRCDITIEDSYGNNYNFQRFNY